MEKKYYVPSIEEFHVGFEFLAKDLHDNLIDETLRPEVMDENRSLRIVSDWLKNDEIRVKRLDREDVTSLGFRQKAGWEYFFKSRKNLLPVKMNFYDDAQNVWNHQIFIGKEIVFNGKIKNKSEFKKILKQIGAI